MKVSNLNGVLSQFLIESEEGTYFQSYNSIIALKSKGVIYLDPDYYKYSKTTSRHLNNFLGVDSKEFKANLKAGLYQFRKMNGQN